MEIQKQQQPKTPMRILLAPRMRLALPSTSLKNCAEKENVAQVEVENVMRGYNCKMRDMNQEQIERAAFQIGAILPKLAKKYGANAHIGFEILEGCQELILNQFLELSVEEIETAYELWSAGKLEVKNADMYHGIFNVSQLGKILSAYSKRRKKIIATLIHEQGENRIKEERAAKNQKLKETFEIDFVNNFEKKRTSIKEWKDVPTFWWEVMKKRKWIQFTKEEALKTYEEAGKLAKIHTQLIESENRVNQAIKRFDLVRDVDAKSLRQNIAGQLMVFRKCIQNPDFIISINT